MIDLPLAARRWAAPMLGIAVTLAAAAVPGGRAEGAAPRQAVGQGDRVVLASTEDTLKIQRRVVATGEIHRVYTVGQVNGEWLWLEAADVAGWAKADRVLPFDQALRQATARIEGTGAPEARDYNARGLLYEDLGRVDLAEADFAEAIRLEPEWSLPYLNRGTLRRRAGRPDEAIADFSQAAKLAPLDPLPYFDRGLALLDQGDPAAAHDSFTLALRADPNHPGSRFNRAATGLALGIDGASADAEAYLALVGWYEALSPYAAILAALEHRRAGRDAQAAGLLDAAAEQLDPGAWPCPILEHLRGRLDLAGLLDAAETADQQAEARAYAGLALVIAGDAGAARPLLEWVVARAEPTQVPHLLARLALEPPSSPPAEPPGPLRPEGAGS
ncbi:tetratricopeptide repeat protein [Tautonia sociabilis]|uniref:Tetratricopeptide repeat protein n=1 Tax=Tautonia sociabilis TaxID=2080755 RepID=A0A432MN67_9BACT|nr:tetratricopeptide repeat protein [Tautonia sociabilis]RUL88556.1 tetratricopeptide repeat protein [Tautonia sociabilis]